MDLLYLVVMYVFYDVLSKEPEDLRQGLIRSLNFGIIDLWDQTILGCERLIYTL